MSKLKYLFLALTLMVAGFSAMAQTSDEDAQRQKFFEAQLGVYNKSLEKNPDDYVNRICRAYLYYNAGMYDEALADVNMAIETTPEKEKDDQDVKVEEYMLRAKIYDYKNDLNNEYADLSSAFKLNTTHLGLVDMIAKCAYKRGDLATAKNNFNVILRANPQNFDALYGLAKVAAKEGNYTQAMDFADRAVKLFPAEPQVYSNRADIDEMTGNYKAASVDLILAMTVGNDEGKAIRKLSALSDTHYNEVMDALQSSIDNAPKVSLLYYLRYSIAMRHSHYAQALKVLKTLIVTNTFDDYSIFVDEARCMFELCQFDDAAVAVNRAISMNNKDIDALVLQARIAVCQGSGKNYAAGLRLLTHAAAIEPNNTDLLLTQARMYIALNKDKEALASLNKLIANDASNAEALLLRGWLNKYRMKDSNAALADFNALVAKNDDIDNLKGFALHELGRDSEARVWAQNIINNNCAVGGYAYETAAALLGNVGDTDQAYKDLEGALANGFGSLYELKMNESPYVNLKQVRNHADFATLLEHHANNFEEKN